MDIDKLGKNDRYDVLTEIADLYYNEGLTQSQIAKKYDTTRFKVAKLLQDARLEGAVEIHINYSDQTDRTLENRLQEKFSLNKAIVVNSQFAPYGEIMQKIGKAGASYIEQLLQKNSCLGITWGKTIYNVINQLENPSRIPAQLVQVPGSFLTSHPGTGARGLVRKAASIYSGTHHYMDAPLYMSSEALRDQMLEEPLLKSTLSETNTMDIILTGVGSLSSLPLKNPLFAPYVSESDKEKEADCIGSIYGYVLDKEGKIADIDLNQKLIAAPLTNILKTPHRLVVAIGRHKVDVLYEVFRNRLANELVTDSETAAALLEKI